jgi:hypothetical protein
VESGANRRQHAGSCTTASGAVNDVSDDLPSITRNQTILKLQRELKQRRGVCARQVNNKKLLPRQAAWRIAVIEATIKLLECGE